MRAAAQNAESLEYHPDIPDLAAVNGVLRGDNGMFRIIVRRYNPQLYRVGMAYLHNHTQVEDAMQNAYIKAFRNLNRFKGSAAFSTWLTRIMINECLMLIRRERRFKAEPSPECAGLEKQESPEPSASESLNLAEMKALLEQAIRKLPRSHRAVYVLREVQRLSTAETSACLGITPANVKVSLHRAKEGLKEQLLKTTAGMELFDYSAAHCDPMTARVMAAIPSTISR